MSLYVDTYSIIITQLPLAAVTLSMHCIVEVMIIVVVGAR